MICKNCGASITNGLTECEYCGSPIEVSEMGIGISSTTQSFVSLLSAEEKQLLSSYMANGNYSTAQRFAMRAFGFNGQQAYEIINQVAMHKDAAIPNIGILIKNLTPKSKDVLFFDETSEKMLKAKAGAQSKYLTKQGYTIDEKILLLYDNAVIKSGESGFTVTNKRLYSSGFFLGDKAFAIPLSNIMTVHVEGNILLINDRKVDIVLVDSNDYSKVATITSEIIRSNR